MTKFYIFDFDGVLCDSTELAYSMHNKISLKYNLPIIRNQTDFFNIIDANSISNFLNNETKENYYLNHRTLMLNVTQNTNLYNGVREIFDITNLKCAIVSSTYRKIIKKILRKNNISTSRFRYIMGRENDGTKLTKIQDIITKEKLNIDDVVYIGDTYSDVILCEKLKIKIILSNYGYSDGSLIQSSNILMKANNIKEIAKFIKNNL